MKYDFTSIIERKGKDATALDAIGKFPGFAPDAPDEGFDAIPMWVADMNFATAPSVIREISKRLEHPAFGYFGLRDEYYDAVIKWQLTANKVKDLAKQEIGYENGVLGAVISALGVFCSRGDKVLVHSPTYIGFTMALGSNGYKIVKSPLYQDDDGIWRMDYDDMEKKLRDENIHAAIICSPHNPTGRVWEAQELERAMSLFKKYDVNVIADEIWSDIILGGNKHIPVQSVSEDAKMRTAAFYAPSKTFNIAGIVGSYHIIYNKTMRERIAKESSLSHYNEPNMLSMYALMGAYCDEGREWVRELCTVLAENVDYACTYINERFEGVSVSKPQGTYMLFVDCGKWCDKNKITIEELERKCWRVGVSVQDGTMFHGKSHIRMNLALPKSRLEEAFSRLDKYVFNQED